MSPFTALVVFAIAMQAVGALCFRRTATASWSTNDMMAAFVDYRMLTGSILVVGYVIAAVAYRVMSPRTSGNEPSIEPRRTREVGGADRLPVAEC
ncbi:MAG: hypothetical protein DLM58_10385 [Pseudonocardiales bacterium]|nr:MAG: hypothetical protein DLM58_10385 [Pseudonocardiales bacterium]